VVAKERSSLMIEILTKKAMRIGRVTLFLPGMIYGRACKDNPAPTATRGMPIEGRSRRSARMVPGPRGLILLSAVPVLAGLAVTASASAATLFTNPNSITIRDESHAAPNPSEIAVGGMTGAITDVTITLHRFGHEFPAEVDILLVSPSGTDVILMSDACGGDAIEDFTWVFSDAAPRQMSHDSSDCVEFTYRPTNYFAGDTWDPPAPPGPYTSSLAGFDGENPNGTWKLYIMDDEDERVGDIEGGWSLSIATDPTAPTVTSVLPANKATRVGLASNVKATFSEAMSVPSISSNTFELFRAGTTTAIGATVSYDAAINRATLNPNNNLRRGVKYRAVITTDAKDVAGNQLDQNPNIAGNQQKVWFFTTRN
jgi:subtilisin-like proprotein convertase family protein